MKIELDIDDKAKPGDIIQFNNKATAIVGEDGDVFLLKYSDGQDWMIAAPECFHKGDYKIIAKSSEWKITWK